MTEPASTAAPLQMLTAGASAALLANPEDSQRVMQARGARFNRWFRIGERVGVGVPIAPLAVSTCHLGRVPMASASPLVPAMSFARRRRWAPWRSRATHDRWQMELDARPAQSRAAQPTDDVRRSAAPMSSADVRLSGSLEGIDR